MLIYGLMLKAQSHVNKILTQNKFSDSAIAQAVEVLKGYTEKIDAAVNKVKDGWARKWVRDDNNDTKVYVETSATAKGEDSLAESTVKIAMIETGSCTLTVGTATSLAVAEGGKEYVQASTFSKATGVDLGKITTYTSKGPNYEKATEAIVLLDWDNVYDTNWVWKKHHKIHDKARKEIGNGNVAVAKADVSVDGDSPVAITKVSSLAIEDTVAETFSSGYATV